MTTSEIEIQNKLNGLKAEIFDLMRQAEYLINLKSQKIQELSTLEEKIRQTNIKPIEKTEKIVSQLRQIDWI